MCRTQTPTPAELVASQLLGWLYALCKHALSPVLLLMIVTALHSANSVIVQALLDSLLAHRFDDAALLAQHVVSPAFFLCAAFFVPLWLERKRITSYLQSKHAVREAAAKLKATADQAAALFAAAVVLFAIVLARVTIIFLPRITRDPPPPPQPVRRLMHALLLPRIFSVSLRTLRA